MLRRPHDHHRDIRARCNPALRSERANASDQDRHVMIVPAPSSPRIALLVLSCGSPRTRFGSRKQHARAPNHISIFTVRSIQRPVQYIARAHCVKINSRRVSPAHQRRSAHSSNPIAAHVARRGPASAPKSRFRPLQVFVRRPPGVCGAVRGGRHPKTCTKPDDVAGALMPPLASCGHWRGCSPSPRTRPATCPKRRFGLVQHGKNTATRSLVGAGEQR